MRVYEMWQDQNITLTILILLSLSHTFLTYNIITYTRNKKLSYRNSQDDY